MSVSGLGSDFTGPGYDVYVYSDADNNARTYSITLGGSTLTIADTATFDGTFNEGNSGTNENYVVFRGLTSGSFSVDMESTPGRGAVNGIQVVAIPEPTSLALFVLGSFLALAIHRRR